ncbi:hypothetical protein ABZ920_27800 [Streptomyces sp. NPDC046831]|uniref:hypothetical protein n=1 Tax=Streptomyces sp. NPDC046831 TaxID=3154805 RepID=UPI0033E614BE
MTGGTEAAESGPAGWAAALRGYWTVICAIATVVLGPAAATASALDRANAAPLRHDGPRADRTQPCLASHPDRRRTAT